jgi:hypothetical protein
VIDSVLDIVLCVCTPIGDAVFAVLSLLSPAAGLVVLSIITGVLMLLVWRHTSNQKSIAACRRSIAASLLATRLFKDNLAVTFRAQRQIVWLCLRLLGLAVQPTLILLIPFTLVMMQIGLRYEFAPARAGEPIRVTATVRPGQSASDVGDALELPEGLSHDPQDPCCAEALRTIDWRLRPERADRFNLRLRDGASFVELPLVVGGGLPRLSSMRGGPWHERLLYSAESSLPATSRFESIRVHYPPRATPILGCDVHWLLTLLVLSIVFAVIFKPILRVHL